MYIIMQVTAEMALKVLNSTTDQTTAHKYAPLFMWFNDGDIKETFKTKAGYSIVQNS